MADMLSQDEINALLGNINNNADDTKAQQKTGDLTEEDVRLISEIGVETMLASANSLEKNLRQSVTIEHPEIEKLYLSESKDKYLAQSIGIKIQYKEGVEGSNVLVLMPRDAKIIANLMQGGDGSVDENELELSMIDESALCETMNQMVGASSTVLFKIVGEKVDIDTPKLFNVNLESDEQFLNDFGFDFDQEFIMSSFQLKIGELIDSKIIQVMPVPFANKLIDGYHRKENADAAKDNNVAKDTNAQAPSNNQSNMNQMQPNIGEQMMGGMQMQNASNQPMNTTSINHNNMNAKPAQFQSFDFSEVEQQKENISIVMDVPLEVTVEMGRTVRKIEEILEFSPGTIIELDKLAGDPIDILVNGKFVAKGEVVVIDENYGIRITEIINFKNRI